MKTKYLGVKLLENAIPMNEQYAQDLGYKTNVQGDPREGYEVEYESGYKSWSPKDEFDRAYKPIDGLTFGLACEMLKEGFVVARKSWPENQFLVKQVPTIINEKTIPVMTSLTHTTKSVIKNEFKKQQMDGIYYSQQLILFQDSLVINSYSATADDIFAEDWYIYN